MNSEYKQKELRKVERAYDWISFISHMHECQYDDEQYYSKEWFHEQLERVYKNLDTRVVMWALNSYKEELKNTLTEGEKRRIRPTNREVMIALFLFALPISKIIFPGVSKKYPSFWLSKMMKLCAP